MGNSLEEWLDIILEKNLDFPNRNASLPYPIYCKSKLFHAQYFCRSFFVVFILVTKVIYIYIYISSASKIEINNNAIIY